MAITSDPIVFAEAIVDRMGNAQLVGSFPLDVLKAGGHRVRIVGIRQVYGVTLDRQGEIQLSESVIAKIAEFDMQTSATVRLTGPNVWGGYHIASRCRGGHFGSSSGLLSLR
jgi:lipase chaperone LimK